MMAEPNPAENSASSIVVLQCQLKWCCRIKLTNNYRFRLESKFTDCLAALFWTAPGERVPSLSTHLTISLKPR